MHALAAPSSARVQVAFSLRSSDFGSTTSIAISLRLRWAGLSSVRICSPCVAPFCRRLNSQERPFVRNRDERSPPDRLLPASDVVVLDRFLLLSNVGTLRVLAAAGVDI